MDDYRKPVKPRMVALRIAGAVMIVLSLYQLQLAWGFHARWRAVHATLMAAQGFGLGVFFATSPADGVPWRGWRLVLAWVSITIGAVGLAVYYWNR